MHRTASNLVVWLAVVALTAAPARAAELADLVVVASSAADGHVIVREGSGPPVAKRVGDTLLGDRYVIRGLLVDGVALEERSRADASLLSDPPALEVRVYVAGPDGRSRVQRFERLPRNVQVPQGQVTQTVGEGKVPSTTKKPQTKP